MNYNNDFPCHNFNKNKSTRFLQIRFTKKSDNASFGDELDK